MRLRVLGVAALAAAFAGVATSTATTTASATSAASPPATHSTIVRPVTSAGAPVHGFRVTARHHRWAIDCSYTYPSPGAVDRDIEECSPSAAYAVACWKAAQAHHALCLRDPTSHHLDRIPLTGRFANTASIKSRLRAPLLIVLANGSTCSIRDGGAWGTLKSHPRWIGRYSCEHGVVWSLPHANHYGINESSAAWTVHTGPSGGKGKLTVRRVTQAYFVGTASG